MNASTIFLLIAILLSGCATVTKYKDVAVPLNGTESVKSKTPQVVIFIKEINVKGVERDMVDNNSYTLLKNSFVKYLRNKLQFAEVFESGIELLDKRVTVIPVSVNIETEIEYNRSGWDYVFYYPVLGQIFPYMPHSGIAKIKTDIWLGGNEAIKVITQRNVKSWSMTYYSKYQTEPVKQAFREVYAENFQSLSKQLDLYLYRYTKQAQAPVENMQSAPELITTKLPEPNVDTAIDAAIFGNYYALVIGVNKYQHLPELKVAKNDALDVYQLLKDQYAFNSQLLLNPSRSEIIKTLSEYRNKLTYNDNLLIYYAGHGWLDKEADEGYWLPSDAEKDNPANWFSNASLTSSLKAMQAKHVMVIADSCYSGKLARGIFLTVKTPGYLQKIAQKRARTVIASGGLEPVEDGSGNHSVFAQSLLTALKDNQGIIDGTELFSLIRRPVMLSTDQTPEYSDIRKAGHEGGDFIFIKNKH